jgi:hypothetical protein
MMNQWAKSEEAKRVEQPEPTRESSATTAIPLPMKRGSMESVGSTGDRSVVVDVDEVVEVVEVDEGAAAVLDGEGGRDSAS